MIILIILQHTVSSHLTYLDLSWFILGPLSVSEISYFDKLCVIRALPDFKERHQVGNDTTARNEDWMKILTNWMFQPIVKHQDTQSVLNDSY